MKKDVSIMIRNNPYIREKIDRLKNIYNIKTDTKLVEYIIDLELQRFNIKIEENSEQKEANII